MGCCTPRVWVGRSKESQSKDCVWVCNVKRKIFTGAETGHISVDIALDTIFYGRSLRRHRPISTRSKCGCWEDHCMYLGLHGFLVPSQSLSDIMGLL